MAQRIRRCSKAFEAGVDSSNSSESRQTIYNSEELGGVFGFFRDFGVRETIESIIVAVVLALMFRAFEAEAFIIPTGSMAPTLQGQHIDVECDKCAYRYRTGATFENTTIAPNDRVKVSSTYCPICNHELELQRGQIGRQSKREHGSNFGDRILVNKFIYDFTEPKRWDVIVFKYPNNGKQNYIKRLVGLPNEKLSIENGDIYSFDENLKRSIVRKPAHKIRVMMQSVDDTDHIPQDLKDSGWPLRWQPWAQREGSWTHQFNGDRVDYRLDASEKTQWLSYRHMRPNKSDWEAIEQGEAPILDSPRQYGQLITDYYCYNDADMDTSPGNQNRNRWGSHWVGDLIFKATTKIESDSGTVALKLVEGGVSYECEIDIATGKATLRCDSETVRFQKGDETVQVPEASTNLKGAGSYEIMFANVDDELHLWVNNRLAKFDVATFVRDEIPMPRWRPSNPGDAEPMAIGGRGVKMSIGRLQVYRDVYYTSVGGTNRILGNPVTFCESRKPQSELLPIFQNPQAWSTPSALQVFTARKGIREPMFQLDDDQLLPMGDNSPHSQDGRIWDGPRYLHKDFLIGRAMFIYWPHTTHFPIPNFTPNFGDMGFIR